MSKWTIDGTQIQRDGQPTFLAGVCYAPTPVGAATFEPGVGDWFAPPWNAIWGRDLPLMQRMGINNVRTYFFWAWTPPKDKRTWREVTSRPPDFDHTEFLDAAAAHGISVTIGIALDGSGVFDGDPAQRPDYLAFFTATAEKLAELYGNHPAVMGFCLGNEQNNRDRLGRTDFWDGLETMARAVRAKAPDKLVMLAMQNDPSMFQATIAGTSLTVPQRFAQIFDVWGLNIYSGMAETLNNYSSQVASRADARRPAIVSEWGVSGGVNVPAGAAGPPDGSATARELTPEEFTRSINGRMKPDAEAIKGARSFVAGAQFFEWSDEWWKNGSTPVDEHNASASPDWPEEWWGLHSIAPVGRTAAQGPWDGTNNQPFPPDSLTARPTAAALAAVYADLSGRP